MESNGDNFLFGLEAEFLLIDAGSSRPRWHPDLKFSDLNAALEAIPVEDLPSLDGLKVEAPHRKRMPYVVEGYHLPDPEFNPIDLLPKGIEIRTPAAHSIDECLSYLKTLYVRLQEALRPLGHQAVVLSFHPDASHFEGPRNKRRHDFWQWAMEAMVTYGPDINVKLPRAYNQHLDQADLEAKVNYYGPAVTALSLASPLYCGRLWKIRGRIGKSIRTYHRSVTAPMIEVHTAQGHRLEFKSFDMACRLEDYRNYSCCGWNCSWTGVWKVVQQETRVYDLAAVARVGLEAEAARERASEVLERAPPVLQPLGFDTRGLRSFEARLTTGRLPADDIIDVYKQEPSIPAVLRHLAVKFADEPTGATDGRSHS